MLKKFLVFAFTIATFFIISSSSVEARTIKVKSYVNSRGTYVNSYYRTSPNRYRYDNYSAKGNYNPYSGKSGTVNWWR